MKIKKQGTASPQFTTERKRLFYAIVILLPFLAVGMLEICLRLFEYGGNLDLVTKRQIGKNEFYSINRYVARRYFAQAGTTIPEPMDDTFEIKKRSNTKRIFCLGESTMAGFPYEFHATAPGFLRDRLQTLLPQHNVEVINVGLSAVSSFVVLDFMNELMSYEPDVFIVYVGHNEFYGAYGVGSTVAIKGGPWMTRTTLSLMRLKIFLLLRDAYTAARRWFSYSEPQPTGSMMGQMAANKTIPINHPLYNEAREVFKGNLTRMIEAAQSGNVPIVFSTLVSNWKDQVPFVSVFNENTTHEQKRSWAKAVADGDSAVVKGQLRDAAGHYESACKLDTIHASPYFKLGKAYYTLQNYDEAKRAFLTAKDLDALRFRATEEFQSVLFTTCSTFNVPLARTDSAFAANSQNGIVGNELITEHLHPNVEGYFLMAKVFVSVMLKNNLFTRANEERAALEKTDAELMELSTVSEFDRTVGKLKVEFLKRRWPFNTGPTNFEFNAANSIERLAFEYVQQKVVWSVARYTLADYYVSNKQFDLARKECLAVAKVIPFSYNPLLRIADYYRMEGKREESKQAYEHCIAVEDNPYAHIKLGLTLLEEDNAAKAAEEFEKAFVVNTNFEEKIASEPASAARYLYGVAYAKMGKLTAAKEQLNIALAINPNNSDAQDLLQQINNLKR